MKIITISRRLPTIKERIIAEIVKSSFCKNCIDKDYAFDVVVDDKKYEVRPIRWTYSLGGEAVLHGEYDAAATFELNEIM